MTHNTGILNSSKNTHKELKMMNFVSRTIDLGTTGPLAKRERKYQGQTVTDMRTDLITRARETIEALEAHKGRPLRAPMARSIRNGIEVKIGYGKRNVGFYEGQGDNRVAIIPELHFAHDRKLLAIDYLQQAVIAVQAGEFDELLSKALADMTARFSGGKADNVFQFAAE
jgi:hypothetical protein